jgi:hypothetical protein
MANIKLQDLTSVVGASLFKDSEIFMLDLSDYELELQGGMSPAVGAIAVVEIIMAIDMLITFSQR